MVPHHPLAAKLMGRLMKHRLSYLIIVVSCAFNAFLIFQYYNLRTTIASQAVSATDSTDLAWGDLFGAYTYAQFGAWLAPADSSGKRIRSPLTLNVFLSSKTECPSLMSEMEVLRRLEPALRNRGQRMIAVCDADDSLGVSELLKQEELRVLMIPLAFGDGATNLAFLGISPFSMPFKVIYDSTFSAIYVRGADNTPESQIDFERAVLRLSDLVYRGEL